jgi:hypothetical protein
VRCTSESMHALRALLTHSIEILAKRFSILGKPAGSA